jgi:O-antigen ligase
MNSRQIPAFLYGLALASMAWSHAAHSALAALALISLVVVAPQEFARRAPQYCKLLLAFSAFIALAYFAAADKERAYNDIKGLWPLAHLFVAAVAISPSNIGVFVHTFLYVSAGAALYSVLQYFAFLPESDLVDQGGRYTATSHVWAFCVCMTTLVAVSFDAVLRRSGHQKIIAATICILALFSLWISQERANFLLAVLCMALIPLLHQSCTKRMKCILVAAIPVLFIVALAFSDTRLAALLDIFSNPELAINSIRILHWQVALEAFQSAPWFGHGLGSYPQLVADNIEYRDSLLPFVEKGHIWCHNMPLQLLATTGIFGTSIAAFVAYKITMPLVRAIKTHNEAAIFGLCACLIHFGTSATDTPSLQSVRLAAFTILVGAAYGAKQPD